MGKVFKINKISKIHTSSSFFGMLLLVAGLGAGVVLVTQPQLLEQKAQVRTDYNLNCVDPNISRSCCPYGQAYQQDSTGELRCLPFNVRKNCQILGKGNYIDIAGRVVRVRNPDSFCSGVFEYSQSNCGKSSYDGSQMYRLCRPVDYYCSNIGELGKCETKDPYLPNLSTIVCYNHQTCITASGKINAACSLPETNPPPALKNRCFFK